MNLAVDIIKKFEGLRLEAYRDSAGVWTIGYGHTGPDVLAGKVITDERAVQLLITDIAWATDTVRRAVRVTLTEEQRAALVSLTFNIGSAAFLSSTVLRRLNASNFEGAADAFLMWNKITVQGQKVISTGLKNRRERERTIFLTGTSRPRVRFAGAEITGGEAKPLVRSKTQWLGLGGVLTTMLTAWGQLTRDAPDVILLIAPYTPYLLGVIFVAVMFNRWMDSRKGVH